MKFEQYLIESQDVTQESQQERSVIKMTKELLEWARTSNDFDTPKTRGWCIQPIRTMTTCDYRNAVDISFSSSKFHITVNPKSKLVSAKIGRRTIAGYDNDVLCLSMALNIEDEIGYIKWTTIDQLKELIIALLIWHGFLEKNPVPEIIQKAQEGLHRIRGRMLGKELGVSE